MTRTTIRMLTLAMVAALLLVAGGCGGGDDEGSGSDKPAATSTAPAAATETGDAAPKVGAAESCKELQELAGKVSEALGGQAGAADAEPERVLNELAANAPAEIKADVQRIADAYSKIVGALGGVDTTSGSTPNPEAVARLQKVLTEIDQPKLAEANTNITAWVTKNCS